MSDQCIKMADQIKQCSDTMSEHCLNVISGSDMYVYYAYYNTPT